MAGRPVLVTWMRLPPESFHTSTEYPSASRSTPVVAAVTCSPGGGGGGANVVAQAVFEKSESLVRLSTVMNARTL